MLYYFRCGEEKKMFGKQADGGGEEIPNSSFCSYWSFSSEGMQLSDVDLMNYYLKRSKLSDLKRRSIIVASDSTLDAGGNINESCGEEETHCELGEKGCDNGKNYTKASEDAMIGANMPDCTLLDTGLSSSFSVDGKFVICFNIIP